MQSAREGKYIWTQHSKIKMRQYGLSEARIKRIIRHPTRTEEGVLPKGVACMQPAGGKNYSEVWVMYVVAQRSGFLATQHSRHDSRAPAARSLRVGEIFAKGDPSKSHLPLSRIPSGSTTPFFAGTSKGIKVITAWRYPGKSPARDPIPADIIREIKNII